MDVLERSDVIRSYACLLIKRPVKLGMIVGPTKYSLKLTELKIPYFPMRQGFQDRVPISLIAKHDDQPP
jgi:hypothetical protein